MSVSVVKKHFDYSVFSMPVNMDIDYIMTFKIEIKKHIEQNNKKIILDFLQTKTLNSGAIGLIISLYKNIIEQNGVLIIARVNNEIKKAFEITKLTNIFKIYDSIDSIR